MYYSFYWNTIFLSKITLIFLKDSQIKTTFSKILFIFRKKGREGEREKYQCVVAPYWGPGLQPRYVPWLGIELVTLWFEGQHSIHWVTPARARLIFSCISLVSMNLARLFVILKIFLFFDFRERKEKREEGRERNIDFLFYLFMHSLVDSYMCPNRESNLQP